MATSTQTEMPTTIQAEMAPTTEIEIAPATQTEPATTAQSKTALNVVFGAMSMGKKEGMYLPIKLSRSSLQRLDPEAIERSI